MNIGIVLRHIYMKFVHGIALKDTYQLKIYKKMLAGSPKAQICRPSWKM